MGQAHLLMGSPKAQAKEGYGPSSRRLRPKLNNIKPKMARRCCRGQFSPRQTQNSTETRGKNGIGTNLKGNLKYLGKTALTTFPIHSSAPDRAILFSFINHSQQLWSWTDGISISLGKVDPTRGRRKVNAC